MSNTAFTYDSGNGNYESDNDSYDKGRLMYELNPVRIAGGIISHCLF
jgi:hypothetical protein